MTIRTRITRFVTRAVLEQPAHSRSYEQLIAALETAGQRILAHISARPDTPRNRNTLQHIIGIERWGQRRLQTALGAPLIDDEYDSYRPAGDTLAQLCQSFQTTRQESIALARQLQAQGIAKDAVVRHNQFGAISVGAWLRYLALHGSLESWRIR
ncbi:MAG TPA: hypothetical protein VGD58_04030 [Herpetosiphonaceae bacterium]